MPTISPRLNLVKPVKTDQFSTSDLANNWQKIDDSPGTFVCTSTTRPSWSTQHRGRTIMETDTGLMWRWLGSDWARMAPSGLLRTSSGAPARARSTTPWSTTSSTFRKVIGLDSVVVPDGYRHILFYVSYPRTGSDFGLCEAAIIRSSLDNGTPYVDRWLISGGLDTDEGSQGGTHVAFQTAPPPGLYNWSFQLRAYSSGQTVTSNIYSHRPLNFWAIEI